MFNIKNIINKLPEKYMNETGGIAISGFSNKLEFTKGIIFSDKKRNVSLQELFDKFVLPNKKIKTLVIDIILNLEEITDIGKIKEINLKEKGIFIGDQNANGTFILPNTKGINDFASAYKLIKQKLSFNSNTVKIYTFETNRLVFEE